jgi:O-acetyl-ADP-ribose deacetylase (regulator of RNase III)
MLVYITGDATRPAERGNKVIPHICNDLGKWGKGFVLAISKRWSGPEMMYRSSKPYTLGDVQFVKAEEDITVANIIGQHDIRVIDDIPPIRYDAVREGLRKVCEYALKNNASIHMPKIGCGLAGGSWDIIKDIIQQELVDKDVDVYVYIVKIQKII